MTEIVRAFALAGEAFAKPKVTINYPFEKGYLSPRFRGEHALRRYPTGEERCIACKVCRKQNNRTYLTTWRKAVRGCVSSTSHFNWDSRTRGRSTANNSLRYWHDEVYLLRILYVARGFSVSITDRPYSGAEACPVDAIVEGPNYEFATETRKFIPICRNHLSLFHNSFSWSRKSSDQLFCSPPYQMRNYFTTKRSSLAMATNGNARLRRIWWQSISTASAKNVLKALVFPDYQISFHIAISFYLTTLLFESIIPLILPW